MKRRTPLILPAVLASLVAACGERSPEGASSLDAQRLMLSQGYSMLYQDATKIGEVDLVLYVKIESEKFDAMVTAISAYGVTLKKELERAARDYPGVRIDLHPLPEMEVRKRAAIGKDRVIQFVPLGGSSQVEYERTMLIGLSNGLNHESHLCGVMAAEEPDAGLKKILQGCQKGYDDFYKRMITMLEQDYFKAPASAFRPRGRGR